MKFDIKSILDLLDFARYYGVHYDTLDAEILAHNFCIALERGLEGKPSGMAMLPSYLKPAASVPAGKTVIAIDAGGTNLRAARLHFDEDGEPAVEEIKTAPMPGTYGQMSAEAFFDAIADCAAPLFENVDKIEGLGFCFSYAMEVKENGEAICISLSKEVDAPEVIGKMLGDGLRQAFARRNIKAPEKIIILNDTAAALLAGLVQIPAGVCDGGVMGFILGTGFNTAYLEHSIPKINFHDEERAQIVVCESAGFAGGFWGELDAAFDKSTKQPGTAKTEKITAGAFLGGLSLTVLKRAINEGLIKFRKQNILLETESLQTRVLNEFLLNPLDSKGEFAALFDPDEEEAIKLVLFLESILTERAAILASAVLAGTMEHLQAGFSPLAPFRIAVEGTTYIRYHHLRKSLEGHLHALLTKHSPRYYVISPVEQASLFGAAMAAGLREFELSKT